MNEIMVSNVGWTVLVLTGTIFVLLLVVNLKVLKQIPTFHEHASILAVCVTILEMFSLRQRLNEENFRVNFILLPYAALAVSVLLTLLLLLLTWLLRGKKGQDPPHRFFSAQKDGMKQSQETRLAGRRDRNSARDE